MLVRSLTCLILFESPRSTLVLGCQDNVEGKYVKSKKDIGHYYQLKLPNDFEEKFRQQFPNLLANLFKVMNNLRMYNFEFS